MKINALIFVIGFVLAFSGGYLFFGGSGDGEANQPVQEATSTAEEEGTGEEASVDEEANEEAADDSEAAEDQEREQTASVDLQPMSNCLSCHAIDSLGVPGGEAGPDLSGIYAQIEGKHGKELDAFLQEPTSAVMATVIEDDPLEDEEREAIVDILRKASEEVE